MSLFQRITRAVHWLPSVRSLSTGRTLLAENTTQTPSVQSTGLYQFFENNAILPRQLWTGRSWKADELRAKSFDDLHKLWYVLLKERNLLATQRESARRLRLSDQIWSNTGRMIKCQKSMARIKFVLNERQIAYEKTVAVVEKEAAEKALAEKLALVAEGKAIKPVTGRTTRAKRAKGAKAATPATATATAPAVKK
ncbi:mitochondrial 39-S ribosomal protein L47 (MRP-L47)-domain-containing protein [Spinellus fusiger]|nr:mitochondrial 39-S ribosomal protein L47 (MRP-L47)-domain-containing protein [Spinellus fusiger]